MRFDFRMIRNKVIAEKAPQPFIQIQPRSLWPAPLLPPPFQTVHIKQVANLAYSIDRRKKGRVVTEGKSQRAATGGMARCLPVEKDRAQSSAGRGWNRHAFDIFPVVFPDRTPAWNLAIDGHIPATLNEEDRKALCESLEPAMLRRNPREPRIASDKRLVCSSRKCSAGDLRRRFRPPFTSWVGGAPRRADE